MKLREDLRYVRLYVLCNQIYILKSPKIHKLFYEIPYITELTYSIPSFVMFNTLYKVVAIKASLKKPSLNLNV